MSKNYKNLSYEELKVLVFEQNQATKQTKDWLYKLAKANDDIGTIKKLANELGFKNAINYIENQNINTIISMDTESIMRAINNGIDVNSKNNKDSSFLHFAVEQDNRALIKFLIDNNININCQDKDGATPLLLASQENNYESIKILIEANADVNLKSKHGYSPLMASVAKFNSIDAARLLIKSGAEINVQDIRGVSPLMLAAQQNFGSMVLLLLENGANTNLNSIEGYNSLHLPCELGHENIVKILLQTDVNINHQDKDGDTPLMIASYHGFKNIIEILLKKNADLNLQNKKGYTALMRAADGNYFEVVRLLVEKGAKLNITSKNNYSALAFSMSKNNKEMTTYLINAGENKIPLKAKELNPMLLNVCEQGDIELVQLFIDNGAGKNYIDKSIDGAGNTPLILACINNHIDIVQILINNNANLDLQNNYGITPLWSASIHGHIDVVKLLLENGANPNIQVGEDKMTALFSVATKRFDENDIYVTTKKKLNNNDITLRIARVLLQNGANPNILNIYESNVLNLCARIGDIEMMKLLLDYGAILDIQENTGLTALMAASHANQLEACKLLIEYGANVNKTSSTQRATALTVAIENNNINIVKLLVKEGADLNLVSSSTLDKNLWGACPKSMEYGIPLEIAKKYGFVEIENFLEEHLNRMEQYKKSEIFLLGQIQLEHNLSIDIFEKYLLFKSKVGEETFENKYAKIEKNTYENDKGKVIVSDKYILKESKSGDQVEHKILKSTGNYLDINNRHNPKALSNLLKNFSNPKLKYTNHDWDDPNLTYEEFKEDVVDGWNEIRENLKILLSEKTYKDIEEFLFNDKLGEVDSNGEIIQWGNGVTIGWSSKEIATAGNKPHLYKNFKDSMDHFKSLFVIKQDNKDLKLLKKFTKLRRENNYKFNLDLEQIKTADVENVFTDVSKLELALATILTEINDRVDDGKNNVRVTLEQDKLKNIIILKIVHIGSTSKSDTTVLEKAIKKDGGFKGIYKNLSSVCDWSIETICPDNKRYKIDYLYPEIDNNKPHSYSIDENIEGFTHILRFNV